MIQIPKQIAPIHASTGFLPFCIQARANDALFQSLTQSKGSPTLSKKAPFTDMNTRPDKSPIRRKGNAIRVHGIKRTILSMRDSVCEVILNCSFHVSTILEVLHICVLIQRLVNLSLQDGFHCILLNYMRSKCSVSGSRQYSQKYFFSHR